MGCFGRTVYSTRTKQGGLFVILGEDTGPEWSRGGTQMGRYTCHMYVTGTRAALACTHLSLALSNTMSQTNQLEVSLTRVCEAC